MQLHEFTGILGTLFYCGNEEINSLWKGLGEDKRKEFLNVCCKDGTVSFVYRKLYEAGVRDGLKALEEQNVRQNVFAIGNQMKFASLCKLLDGQGIRYSPIKGIDLAFRVYPSPELRLYCDWDVLFHYDDIFKAVRLLADNGWTTNGKLLNDCLPKHFHYPIMHKDGLALEPHWTLPAFDGVEPAHIWQFIHPMGNGTGRHVLEPALNMLLLTRHASRGFYTVMPLSRMLLDAAFIMKSDGFDWRKCREVSDELKLPCSADLLYAFDEFFPKSVRDEMQADSERAEAYRKVFELRDNMAPRSNRDNLVFNSANHFSWHWLRGKIKAKCSGKHIRKVHQLPSHGHQLKVIGYMLMAFLNNVSNCIGFLFRRNTAVMDYAALIKKAEGTSTE